VLFRFAGRFAPVLRAGEDGVGGGGCAAEALEMTAAAAVAGLRHGIAGLAGAQALALPEGLVRAVVQGADGQGALLQAPGAGADGFGGEGVGAGGVFPAPGGWGDELEAEVGVEARMKGVPPRPQQWLRAT
jgi:hypothetical protein